MRYAILLLLVGCVAPPDMVPMVIVSAELASTASPPPSDTCENCGGLGYLGDSVVKRDCPECEIPWSMTPDELLSASHAEIGKSISELRESVEALSMKLDTMQSSCPVPVMEINDAKVLAERLWEEFEEDYQERFYEGFQKHLTVEEVRKEGVLTPSKAVFTSYAEAIREATNRDQVLLLVFSSRTCEPCDRLKAAQDSVPLKDVVVCRLYVEDNPDLFRNYGVTRYPTQVVRFRSRELARATGAMDRNYFYQWIEGYKKTAPSIYPQ